MYQAEVTAAKKAGRKANPDAPAPRFPTRDMLHSFNTIVPPEEWDDPRWTHVYLMDRRTNMLICEIGQLRVYEAMRAVVRRIEKDTGRKMTYRL